MGRRDMGGKKMRGRVKGLKEREGTGENVREEKGREGGIHRWRRYE